MQTQSVPCGWREWHLLSALIASFSVASIAPAATFMVGPDGTYSAIQTGIAAALIVGGSNEIDVEAGSYSEHLTATLNAGTITIVGGWNPTFTQHSLDPASTQVSGGGSARVLTATINGGKLSLNGLSLIDGSDTTFGGGLSATLFNSGALELRNSRFSLNTVTGSATSNTFGGGIYVQLQDTAALIVDGVDVSNNSVAQSASTWGADGGGIFIEAFNASNASISNSNIHDNTATATATAYARSGALEVAVADSAHFSLSRSRVVGNIVSAAAANHAANSGTFVPEDCAAACEVDFTLDAFDHNLGPSSQLDISLTGAGTPKAYLADLLISDGDSGGLEISTDVGVANAVNLTIADNAGLGLYLSPFDANSKITFYNSAVFGNGTDYSSTGAPEFGNNLIGTDPHFVDAANGDFHVRADSPARDAGTASPPGGLGLFDLDGTARTFGPKPDIGAYEVGDKIFRNGFD